MTTIALIIKFRTTGGRHHPTTSDGELVAVEEDGVSRPPTATDPEVAYKWLMSKGYEPAGTAWLDPAGYIRRRKQVYRREQ